MTVASPTQDPIDLSVPAPCLAYAMHIGDN